MSRSGNTRQQKSNCASNQHSPMQLGNDPTNANGSANSNGANTMNGDSICEGSEYFLARHASCHAALCQCSGWRLSEAEIGGSSRVSRGSKVQGGALCVHCKHDMDTHLLSVSAEMRRICTPLAASLAQLQHLTQSESDPDTVKVYEYVIRFGERSLKQHLTHRRGRRAVASPPALHCDQPFGQPPYYPPNSVSIARALCNLGAMHSEPSDAKQMYVAVAAIVDWLDEWKMPNASVYRREARGVSDADVAAYKVNYTRWLINCHLPKICPSLQHHYPSAIFGRNLLQQIIDPFAAEVSKSRRGKGNAELQPDVSTLLTHLSTELTQPTSTIFDQSTNPLAEGVELSDLPEKLKEIIEAESENEGSTQLSVDTVSL